MISYDDLKVQKVSVMACIIHYVGELRLVINNEKDHLLSFDIQGLSGMV